MRADTPITNGQDVIDSRDVIDRIEYLQNSMDATDIGDGLTYEDGLTEDERAELASLLALAAEAEGYAADWQYGETLIRDTYFEDYARELAEDIGAFDSDARSWPYTCIDWQKAARELRMDYTSVDFNGITYWIR